MKQTYLLAVLISATASGCLPARHSVVASTGTVIGLEIAQNPASQMYQAKLGYNRAELAVVPSNRSSDKGEASTGGGASDTADVVMELNYANIFSLSQSGIYQRLAVGKFAVSQPGAAFMFAKGKDGVLDPQVASSVAKAIQSIPVSDPDVVSLKVPLAKDYAAKKASEKERFDAAAKAEGFASFEAFLMDTATTAAQVNAVAKRLQ